MQPIKSYVFMHLETTGLPSEESNQTRITELGMVVLKRNHITRNSLGELPRIINKLLMVFKPDKEISEEAANLSGLEEDMLQQESMFNENACVTIKSFLECQIKPVCLVAHNGHKFGLPLLKNHFERWELSLPEDLKCVDSRHGFYELLECPQVVIQNEDRHRLENNIDNVLASIYYNNDLMPQQSFSLNGIYERVFKRHTAESRSIMIAQLAVATPKFLEWVDNMYCPFSQVRALMSDLHFLL